jgi:hypothetical protein
MGGDVGHHVARVFLIEVSEIEVRAVYAFFCLKKLFGKALMMWLEIEAV